MGVVGLTQRGLTRRVERTGGSRHAQRPIVCQGRLPPVAHPDCSATSRVMHCSIAIVLFALAVAGCSNAPQNATNSSAALQVWRSHDASLQQRADAVTELFPRGTSKDEVERVLARKGMWTRYHGLSVDAINNRQLPDHDYWRLVYEFPGGGVSLEFEPATAFGDRFARATPFQTLMSVPLTNSP